MYLNKSLPLVFGTPEAKAAKSAILYSLYVAMLATTVYLAAMMWDSFPYFPLMTFILGVHGYICVLSTAGNLFFLFRYFLVWVLVFGTALVWSIFPDEVYVAPFGLQFQTDENTRILVFACLLSLCGSLIGWQTALRKYSMTSSFPFSPSKGHRFSLRAAGILVASLFAILYIWKVGGIVGGGKVYADGQEGFALTFGVFNLFHFTGIALILLGSINRNQIGTKFLLLSIFTLIPGMLAGSRADFLPQAFILFLFLFNTRIQNIVEERKYFQGIKYFIVLLLTLSCAYLIATFIAIARGGVDALQVLEIMLANETGRLISSVYGHKMLYFETGNMMLGGLYSAIVQVREGHTGLLLGKSYFNFLLIAPPAFLGLPRPLGLEWATNIDGVTMTQGGIFEVAEAYWNFGLAGCFLISFTLSYIFGWILRRGLIASNYFFLAWFIVYGLHGFRSVWYQTFGYFRLMTVMLLIYLFCSLFHRWFIANRRFRSIHFLMPVQR